MKTMITVLAAVFAMSAVSFANESASNNVVVQKAKKGKKAKKAKKEKKEHAAEAAPAGEPAAH